MAIPAMAENRYASIIVDADTLEVLHARQIDELRYPASLTKVMTLYLAFDALDRGELRLDQALPVSRNAARTPPVKMGVKTGQSIKVDTLIQSIAVRSSNDAAVVLAEALAGTEEKFAAQMTAKARELGMMRTTFMTPNGLPHPDQQTTARDMAKLASAILTHHGDRYHYFGQTHFRGKSNTNKLLATRPDVDGFKTGYTRASGYNLMVSAKRDGRRLIAIVLGGASTDSRNQHMSDLIDRGFEVMSTQAPPVMIVERNSAPATQTPVIVRLRGRNSELIRVQTAGIAMPTAQADAKGWTVQIKDFSTPMEAEATAQALSVLAGGGEFQPRSGFANGRAVYHARLTGLSAQSARAACDGLKIPNQRCWVIAP
ncbi:D-alanyl-D-alanine carboxypeptidase family protein [Litorimonas sp. RW-G-Af-16]|uniref:D-alanyl-D-alanine carboxypeptidase family protein n=1 Tax=Litorimonas sp. RW-G-Af-16 TaxID=3241168 RepID=UPI00390C6F37